MEIRQISADDIDQVYELGNRYFDKTRFSYAWWGRKEIETYYKKWKQYCFVCCAQEKIIGCVLAAPKYETINVGYIEWVIVDEKHRGKKVATQLCEKVEKLFKAQNLDKVVVDIEQNNQLSLNLFRKRGYSEETKIIFLSKQI